MKIHTSAGCYLIRNVENDITELLVIHRHLPDKGEVYVIPKGHQKEDETLEETALRETTEETGYTDFEILMPLGSKTYILDLDEGIEKTDHYFLAQLRSEHHVKQILTEAEAQSGFTPVWMPYEEAFERLTWENSSEILVKIQDYLEEKK